MAYWASAFRASTATRPAPSRSTSRCSPSSAARASLPCAWATCPARSRSGRTVPRSTCTWAAHTTSRFSQPTCSGRITPSGWRTCGSAPPPCCVPRACPARPSWTRGRRSSCWRTTCGSTSRRSSRRGFVDWRACARPSPSSSPASVSWTSRAASRSYRSRSQTACVWRCRRACTLSPTRTRTLAARSTASASNRPAANGPCLGIRCCAASPRCTTWRSAASGLLSPTGRRVVTSPSRSGPSGSIITGHFHSKAETPLSRASRLRRALLRSSRRC
mmetsp:Transcript_14639/g.46678  ORF Transcript_14639/g.46678 Transcript_14639/m.46678 type:complete len:275 (+) Transcript_14639:486-1310(+)